MASVTSPRQQAADIAHKLIHKNRFLIYAYDEGMRHYMQMETDFEGFHNDVYFNFLCQNDPQQRRNELRKRERIITRQSGIANIPDEFVQAMRQIYDLANPENTIDPDKLRRAVAVIEAIRDCAQDEGRRDDRLAQEATAEGEYPRLLTAAERRCEICRHVEEGMRQIAYDLDLALFHLNIEKERPGRTP